ncbi:uncharacterized protein PAE49_021558 [Odontesthes bonariensis]|uniref:uncharacterized protein LOC142368988 n=1 Tax=Odontesthes bonariensis TaxID=219752 RepID=UPI003F58942D
MPAKKSKVGSMSHRYRPASEYDDATLAQKREYWRNKKREQRARLSEQRGKPTPDSRGGKLPHLYVSAGVNPSLSDSFAVLSPLSQSGNDSYNTGSQSGNAVGESSLEGDDNQKEWHQPLKVNKVLQFISPSKKAEGNTAIVKKTSMRSGCKVVSTPSLNGAQLNIISSVPPVTMTRISNGSSTKTASQPCVSMQSTVPKTRSVFASNAACALDVTLVSPCGRVSVKTEGKTINTTPQSGTKSASVTTQRAKGIGSAQPPPKSDEEKAAKRREHWRIKKREQRAKLAARIAKVREKTQGGNVSFQRLTAQKTGLVANSVLLQPQLFLRGAAQKQCSIRGNASFPSIKRDTKKPPKAAATGAVTDLQMDQMTVQKPHGRKVSQTDIAIDWASVKKPAQPQRKVHAYTHYSNVIRGIARCKTPRQRFIETQKNFMNQRNFRCKPPSMASMFGTRDMHKSEPSDTPEQIIAKRREYWRIKKREQRAKLSVEMKSRLKDKDALMRRVKRYQQILEEMRKARALTRSTESVLTHASETFGGFIKEDGTLTVNIPQSPEHQNAAGNKGEEELHGVSKNNPATQPQHQTNMKQRAISPIRTNQLSPPLHPSQVKASSHAVQLVKKSLRLMSIKPQTHLEITTIPNSQSLAIQNVSQLTLTPQSPQHAPSTRPAAGSNFGGCVRKMVISSSVPSPSILSLDPALTEEERMVKKREYWRIKKREQRAARAVQLKQDVLQVRANASLQRRKAQKQESAATGQLGTSLANCRGDAQPLSNSHIPFMPQANEIKQESESVPAVDLNSPQEQAIYPDIKLSTSPPTSPAPQPEPDPSLSTDSQATTLLAVASMKKLLEESLSTVAECKSVQTDLLMETKEDASERDIKPNLSQLFFEKDDMAPIAADLTLQIKSWQPDSNVLAQKDSPSPRLKNSPQSSETPPPLPTSDVIVHSNCEHPPQTPSTFTVNLAMEASDGPTSPRRTQRLCSKTRGHQKCCSPEPPKLHHVPDTSVDQLHPQQQHCEQQCQAQDNGMPSAQRYCSVVTEHSGSTSLQRKREYWKLMKRQQRARLKARQRERHGECSSWLIPRNTQTPGLITSTLKGVGQTKPAPQPRLSATSVAAATCITGVLVVRQTSCTAEQSPDALQVNLPVTGREKNNMNVGSSQNVTNFARVSESQHRSQDWTSQSTEVDPAPSLPTLKPPDNPLSIIDLQPIESPGQSPNSTLGPRKLPCAPLPSPTMMIESSTNLAPISTLVPPKPVPGESEEDFLRRKREYWRIKKKEQRARKAIRDKGISTRSAFSNWRPILPSQDLQKRTRAAKDSGQWVNPSEKSEHLMSMSLDPDPEPFPFSNYGAPVEDESELLFDDYEDNNDEEGALSDSVWRSRYLMDYDPLNQLLVCMVCGELQYSHNLEGVRAHIDETHPHTLTLEPKEKQRILEAWDEQVSQRERFFTSQLQQHSGALTETHRK